MWCKKWCKTGGKLLWIERCRCCERINANIGRKEGSKEGRKQGSKEARKQGSKEVERERGD